MKEEKLRLVKNKEMRVKEYEERVEKDPLRGDFDPEKDFKAEIYTEAKIHNWEPYGLMYKFIEGVRIVACPYSTPSKCPWLLEPSFRDRVKICQAVRQTIPIMGMESQDWDTPMCKVHVARRERLDVEG